MRSTTYDDDYPTCQTTYATLRIYHLLLNTDRVTRELGLQPTRTQESGQLLSPWEKQPLFARIGGWFLSTEGVVDSRDVRRHVDWLLDQIEPHGEALKKLQAEGCQIDIFCYWCSAQGHGGPMLSPESMIRLGTLGLEIGFDIYLPLEKADPQDGQASK